MVSVKDQGLGIPEGDFDHIFQPYFSTQHIQSSNNMVELWIEGTIFRFFIPASNQDIVEKEVYSTDFKKF